MFKILILFLTLASSLNAFSAEDPWQTTLDSIEAKYEEIYCFKDLKRELFGWNSHRSMNHVRKGIASLGSTPAPQAAKDILYSYFDSTRDIHVGPRFKTSSPNSITRLPFSIRSAGDGHYLLVGIDRKALPEDVFPYRVGDELITIGGKSAQAWVDEYLPLFYAQKKTQQALAERYALNHYDVLGKSMPTGMVKVEVRRAGDRVVTGVSVSWIPSPKKSSLSVSHENEELRVSGKGAGLVSDPRIDGEFVDADPIANYGKVGAKKPFFPGLGKIVWESADTDPYYAYTFELPNGKLGGYVRVPTYYPADMIHVSTPGFFTLIDRFVDAGISVLVYDQTNNGGGSLLYAYDLMSALIDHPVAPKMKTEWIASETHHEFSLKWSDLRDLAVKAKTDPVSLKKFQEEVFSDKLVDADFIDDFISEADHMLKHIAKPKHSRLAPPIPFEGVKWIKPNSGKHFTGPILMLNNELSISSADLTPALFQDLGRAVMFGSKTSGAGAYQNGFLAPEKNPYELYYYSISFGKFTRPHGVPVETFGVRPDIAYDVTRSDLTDGMKGYREAVTKALLKLTR